MTIGKIAKSRRRRLSSISIRNWFRDLNHKVNIFQQGALRTLPVDLSTRQGVRHVLFNNAFVDAGRFAVPRCNRRKIARQTARRLWTQEYGPQLRERKAAARASVKRMQEPGLPNPYAKLEQ